MEAWEARQSVTTQQARHAHSCLDPRRLGMCSQPSGIWPSRTPSP